MALMTALVGMIVLPGAAFAVADAPKTNGSMVSSAPFFNGGLGRWQWNIQGSSDAKQAKGTLTLTIFDSPYPEATSVFLTQSRRAVDIRRAAPNTVEFSLDEGTTGPGDPMWAENLYRVIDNGKAGDELWQRCWRCSMSGADVWHRISDTGSARVR